MQRLNWTGYCRCVRHGRLAGLLFSVSVSAVTGDWRRVTIYQAIRNSRSPFIWKTDDRAATMNEREENLRRREMMKLRRMGPEEERRWGDRHSQTDLLANSYTNTFTTKVERLNVKISAGLNTDAQQPANKMPWSYFLPLMSIV